MSIEQWLDEDGRKAIERMGWPKWYCRVRLWARLALLAQVALVVAAGVTANWLALAMVAVSVAWHLRVRRTAQGRATALLRDHAREWLAQEAEAHGYDLLIIRTTDVEGEWEISLHMDQGAFVIQESDADIDAALIAAVLAAKEHNDA